MVRAWFTGAVLVLLGGASVATAASSRAGVTPPPDAPRATPVAGEAPPAPRSSPAPATVGLSGALVPGLGHLLLGEGTRAALVCGGTAGLFGAGLLVDPGRNPLSFDSRGFLLAEAASSLWSWSAWDAYQLTRMRHPRPPGTAFAAAPRQDLPDLLAAPFTPAVVASPDVIFPLLLLTLFAAGQVELGGQQGLLHRDSLELAGRPVHPAAAWGAQQTGFGVLSLEAAVGEEALFRGLLLQLLAQGADTALANGVQAGLFGLLHFPNPGRFDAGASLEDGIKTSLFTGVFGAYLGHLTGRHGGDLRPAVALHFWYNLLLLTTAYIASPEDTPLRLQLGWTF